MNNKTNIITSIEKLKTNFSQSPIIKGLIDGSLSLIPFFGTAIISALDTRSFQIYEKNSKRFIDDVKSLVDKLDETKIDKEFLDSDEFVSLLTEILARNARTYEHEKTKLYARAFVNAATLSKSKKDFKEGFVRIIDELSVMHVIVLAFIHEKILKITDDDKKANKDFVSTSRIADETRISITRAQAYCDQMIRFGLLHDWSLGRYDYTPGNYIMTDYGNEFVEFLKIENK